MVLHAGNVCVTRELNCRGPMRMQVHSDVLAKVRVSGFINPLIGLQIPIERLPALCLKTMALKEAVNLALTILTGGKVASVSQVPHGVTLMICKTEPYCLCSTSASTPTP